MKITLFYSLKVSSGQIKSTLETMSFNPFIVNENMNKNNQEPDLNFFHESVSSFLDTDYVSPKDFKGKFKDYLEISLNLFLFFTSKFWKPQ